MSLVIFSYAVSFALGLKKALTWKVVEPWRLVKRYGSCGVSWVARGLLSFMPSAPFKMELFYGLVCTLDNDMSAICFCADLPFVL